MHEMKKTNIVWLPCIPDTWTVDKVKNCFTITKDLSTETNPVVLKLARSGVEVRDITNNEGQIAASYDNYNKVIAGDLLLNPMDLYSGANCNVSEINGVISPAYANLRPHPNINSKYFDYYFKTQYWAMAMFAHGKGVSYDNRWTINNEAIKNYEIPMPPFWEQCKIVELINNNTKKVDALINNQEQQIEKLKQYKQSIITEVVTKGLNPDVPMKDSGVEWIGGIPEKFEMMKMKHLGKCRNGLTYSPENLCDESGMLVLRSSNIKNGVLCFNDNVYVDVVVKKELMVKKGDILICSRNGSKSLIGKNAIIDSDLVASFGAFMMIFRSKLNTKYIYYILNSNVFSYYLGTYLTATINQLTGENFNNMIVPFCFNEKVQNEIVLYLDKECSRLDKLIALKQQKIEKLQAYKKSLIYEYVTGKKKVIA